MRWNGIPGCALLAALVASCGAADGGPAAPDVLLVTLDTTRADRLGCYGWEPAVTPTIDALAAGGVRFERAYTHVPFTMPSHATVMTGVHPDAHGLHINYTGVVSEDVTTLAELFAARGHRTGAFIAARVLSAEFGLARGFERYADVRDAADGGLERVARPADEVTDEALAWLSEDDDRPFFAWVHYFDAHDPYQPPPAFADVGQDAYDGEVAFMDAQLARILARLDALGRRERTLVVLVADHGESLGDHGEPTHGMFVYDSSMRVPLVFAGAGVEAVGATVAEPVGLVDLFPTVLEQAGLATPAQAEGRSLAPALRGEALAAAPIRLESEYGLRCFRWAPLHALVSGEWKLIDAPAPELYRIAADPRELDDLAAREPEVVERLRDALATRRAAAVRRAAGALAAGADDAAELSKLGYLGGFAGELELEDTSGLRDPKDGMPIFLATQRADELYQAGRAAEALALLEPLVAESPESAGIWSLLGQVQLELGSGAAAQRSFEECLRLNPDVAWRQRALGDALRMQGDRDGALVRYERALELEPDAADVHSRLGLLRAQAGDLAAATAHFRRQVELEPDSANARCNLANALLAGGAREAALAELRAALRVDPDCAPAHRALVPALAATGRRAELLAALHAAHAALPDDLGLTAQLAWRLATDPGSTRADAERALELAEACVRALPDDPGAADLLAAAAAATGDFPRALAEEERALRLAAGRLPPERIAPFEARLAAYGEGRPWRE